jgi:hypothetical protein
MARKQSPQIDCRRARYPLGPFKREDRAIFEEILQPRSVEAVESCCGRVLVFYRRSRKRRCSPRAPHDGESAAGTAPHKLSNSATGEPPLRRFEEHFLARKLPSDVNAPRNTSELFSTRRLVNGDHKDQTIGGQYASPSLVAGCARYRDYRSDANAYYLKRSPSRRLPRRNPSRL